jgi:hypothetical protein
VAGDPSRQQRPDKGGRKPAKGNAHGPVKPGSKKPAPISQSDTKWVKKPGQRGYVVQISTGKRVNGKVAIVAKGSTTAKKGVATYAKGKNVTGAKKATPTRRPASGSSGSTGTPPGRRVMGKAAQYANGTKGTGPGGKKMVVRNGKWVAAGTPAPSSTAGKGRPSTWGAGKTVSGNAARPSRGASSRPDRVAAPPRNTTSSANRDPSPGRNAPVYDWFANLPGLGGVYDAVAGAAAGSNKNKRK